MIQKIFLNKLFPLMFQILTLLAFLLLIIIGLAANTNDLAFAKILRNTNIANLVVWSYWWPLIIILSVLIGRVWCTVCPMELMTSLSARIGLKKKPPKIFKSGWIITLFYVLILFIGIHTLSIHRIPFRMAIYLISLFLISVITGLIFEKNTFCSSVCPVGYLLGLYARIAPFGWGVKDTSICRDCEDKSCISNINIYRFQAKSCGVNLVPQHLDDNTNCLLCGQCLKACDKFNPGIKDRPNPGFGKKPFAKDLFSLKPINLAQSIFVLIVSGFVVYEIYVEWKVIKEILLFTPNYIQKVLSLSGVWSQGIIQSVTIFIILPLILWSIPFVISLLKQHNLSFVNYLKIFGISFIPIMASAHIIKSILKTTSRIPYWQHTIKDPIGINTAQMISSGNIILNKNPKYLENIISVVILLLICAGIGMSIVIIKKILKSKMETFKLRFVFYLIPVLYGGIFFIPLIIWRTTLGW